MNIYVTRHIDPTSRSKRDFRAILPVLKVKHLFNHLETRVVLLFASLLLHCFAGVWEHDGDGPS